MKLGGNIELEGFESVEPAQLIVIKKIVGSNAKKITEEVAAFENLCVTLKSKDAHGVTLSGKIVIKGSAHESEASDKNLFFALNELFTKLNSQIR